MSRNAALVGHALVGWAMCGTTIAVARQVLSMPNTLVHAIVAPLVFALLSMHFCRRYPAASPLGTSLWFMGIVVGLDAFVVAPLIERSYTMFTSPIGTWIPLLLMAVKLPCRPCVPTTASEASTANATRVWHDRPQDDTELLVEKVAI